MVAEGSRKPREETEAAGGGKGRGSLSSAFPFLSWLNTQIPPSSSPGHPHHYHTMGCWPQGAGAISILCYNSCGQEQEKRGKEGSGPSGCRAGPRGRAQLVRFGGRSPPWVVHQREALLQRAGWCSPALHGGSDPARSSGHGQALSWPPFHRPR